MRGTPGTPATLGIVTDKWAPNGPLIEPYPSWSWFKPNDCNSLINIYRIAVE